MATQSHGDPEFLPLLFDKHLASIAQRIQNILGEQENALLFVHNGAAHLFVIIVEHFDSLRDIGLKVLSKEHEHVDWPLEVLTSVDHEDELVL